MATKIEWTESVWKQIPHFENYYASKDGKILSKAGRQLPHIMKPISAKDGHQYVYLYDGYGNQKKMFVHRAVLMAWVGMPGDGQECRHLNDIPTDNRLVNLAWGSRMENVEDKRRNGGIKYGESSSSHKLSENQVIEIRKRYSMGECARDLGVEYGIAPANILAIIRGEHWKHLPTFPIVVKHKKKPNPPMTDEQKKRWLISVKEAAKKRRTKRELIPCACGCGEMVETPDSRGRERKYLKGHNNRK